MNVYAVIHTGGKQYRVSPGDVVRVEKLAAQPGEKIELDQVYLMALDGRITTGNPVLKNARVVTQVLDQDRGEKLIIFKHRRRKGYRKTTGHRQYFTALKVIEIIHEGASYQEQPEKQRQSQKPAVVPTAPAVKKADAAKRQTATKKDPAKQPVSATKPETEKTPPASQRPEPPRPAEQRVAPKSTPAVASELSPTVEPAAPAAPPLEPGKPQTPVQASPEEKPRRREPAKRPASEAASDKRRSWWIIGAIIAALALLALVLLIRGNRPTPGPETRQETVGKPAPEKQSKPKPLVRDVKIKKTAPVDKPSAPAQPPD